MSKLCVAGREGRRQGAQACVEDLKLVLEIERRRVVGRHIIVLCEQCERGLRSTDGAS